MSLNIFVPLAKLKSLLLSSTRSVINLIECKRYLKQCTGETSRELRTRFGEHRPAAQNNNDETKFTFHENVHSPNHSHSDMKLVHFVFFLISMHFENI